MNEWFARQIQTPLHAVQAWLRRLCGVNVPDQGLRLCFSLVLPKSNLTRDTEANHAHRNILLEMATVL